MPIDVLQIESAVTLNYVQLAVFRPGLGAVYGPQSFSVSNTYEKGDTDATQVNGALALNMLVDALGTEYVDISSTGSERDPTNNVAVRLETLKEFVLVLLRQNPADGSDCPESVAVTLSDSVAKALGFSGGPLTYTLQYGHALAVSNPAGFPVAANGRVTVVNNDTMLDATVLVLAAGFIVS